MSTNFRNDNYLEYIRKQNCLVTDSNYDTVAHHIRLGQNGGMGLKPSDYRCIPLSFKSHIKLHNTGEKTFYKDHGIDKDFQIMYHLIKYILANIEPTQAVIEDLETLVEKAKKV